MVIDEKAIFVAAVGQPDVKEREAYLQEACAGHPELLGRLRALLSAHEESQGPLDRPPAALAATLDETQTERPGMIIGTYKLMEQIGEGGMGLVFVAEQQHPVRRKVALKVIKPGMDTRQVIARFEAERQALALMDHPNIAKVLDGGETASGRPYFVMELVKGVPITDYCDQNQVSVRERLELFLHLCQAVQHAHQKGIIHRDLKPTNVLVTLHDGVPVPKIIDFGVAKAIGQQLTDKTIYTNFAQLVGTPMYMSPEQAALSSLDVDTRSDIYSLGVLLYELLTGTTPFDKNRLRNVGYEEIRRIIREEEPPKPSTRISTLGRSGEPIRTNPARQIGATVTPETTNLATIAAQRRSDPRRLNQLFRGELDWIVMKCLEKDRNRRYESPYTLARDIERYLRDEPVQACPPSAGYRLRKLARRNKVALTMAAVIASVLLLATGVSTWQAVRAIRADRESRYSAAELALDKGQLLGESDDANLALLWMARSLKLAPADATGLQAAIRTNLGAWQRQVNKIEMVLPEEGPFGVGFDANGKIVTVSVKAGTDTLIVRRRDPMTGRFEDLLSFSDESSLKAAIASSPDWKYLLIACDDGTFRMRDLSTGKSLWEKHWENCSDPKGLEFSHDGKKVVIGYAEGPSGASQRTGLAQLFDTTSGKTLGPVLHHRHPVLATSFHPDGRSFVTECGIWGNGREKGEAHFWNFEGQEIREPMEHVCMAPAVAFSPDGTKLLTGHWDYKARLWDLATPDKPVVLEQQGPVLCVGFSPDGQTLLTGSANASVQLWDLNGKRLGPPLRQGHQVMAAEFSTNGKSLIVVVNGNSARLWDLSAIDHARRTQVQPSGFFPLAFSPDRKTILTRDAEYTIQLRDAASNQAVGKPLPHQRPVLIAGSTIPPGEPHACSSDRFRALTVDADNVARLWDTQTGRLITQLKPLPEALFLAAAFSPDNKSLVTGGFASATHVWDATTGKLIRKLESQSGVVFRVAFRHDGGMLLTANGDKTARFWDSDTGVPIDPPLFHDCAVLALTWSPNGELVLTGNADENAQVWKVETRRRLIHLSGHHALVNVAAFSPDGRLALTGSHDHTARLWDLATGKPVGPPLLHPGPVVRVAFDYDGQTILTATEDQMARTWPVPTAMSGSPEEIELWAQLATGMELEPDGSAHVLDAAAWQSRRQKLEAMVGNQKSGVRK
jgi:WD40 repeat protein/serine/threonine protein kinase